MNIEKTFTLEYPFELKGKRYETLDFRRPKTKDLRSFNGAEKDPVGAMNKFLANLAEIPPDVFDEVDLEDMATIRKWAEGFLSATNP